MTICKHWSPFFVAAALVVSALAKGDFRFSLEPQIIQPGQRAVLTLRLPEADLRWLEGSTPEDVFPEAEDESLLESQELEFLSQDYRKEKSDYVWRYEFTAYSTGEIVIPPISVRMGPQSFSSERRTLQVVSNRTDGELRPNAGAVYPPWDWSFWLGGLLLLALAAAVYWLGKRYWPRRTPQSSDAMQTLHPQELPKEWLKKQFLILRARMESMPQEPNWPDTWFAILKEFTCRDASVPAKAWTTSELRSALKQDSRYSELAQLLSDCDLWKFSPSAHKVSPTQITLKWIEESERIFL